MKTGCPKEIKNNENRVGLTPNAAHAYVAAGHEVFIQKAAGLGSACSDEEYVAAGASILATADEVWAAADMIVKVKEPIPEEYYKMCENQLVYTYFHFAADEGLTRACLKKKIIALAYETVEESRALPLLKPMSEVAGRMASLMGAYARTSTFALNNATLRYGLMLADKGVEKACMQNQGLKMGLNMYKGAITYEVVADAFGMQNLYKPVDSVIN